MAEALTRIACGVCYHGAPYHGWQRQQSVSSVQAWVEKALSHIANEPVEVQCAGRTDAGVHAKGQVIHFDTKAVRDARAWVRGANAILPPSIRIVWAREVGLDFHARFSAQSRTYQYWIDTSPVCTPFDYQQVLHFPYSLDPVLMHSAAQHFLGEQDFSAIRASGCQSKTPWRCVTEAQVFVDQARICYQVTANAFVHHMVRNMVGMLLPVGQRHQSPDWVQTVLASKDRTQAGVTAPPEGLYLMKVDYGRSDMTA